MYGDANFAVHSMRNIVSVYMYRDATFAVNLMRNNASAHYRLRSLKWLPIREKLILNDATMMHKCINKLVPDYLADMFKLRSQVHNRQTRSSGALNIPLCRLSTGQRFFAFRGAKLWNSLNDNIASVHI